MAIVSNRSGTWRTYDATNGLVAGVWCLLQDEPGYLWLGTRAGLCRYDGCEFVTYTRADGLPHDEITAAVAVDGLLWLGTRGGLACWDGRQFARYTAAAGLPADEIEDLCADAAGRLWIATHGGLACFTDGEFRVWGPAEGLPTAFCRAVCVAADQSVWIGTEAGLARLAPSGEITCYHKVDGLPADHVLSVLEDRSGVLWAGTLIGLARRVGERFETVELVDNQAGELVNIRGLHQGADGRLWIGSIGRGLHCFDGATMRRYGIADGLIGEHVTCVLEDVEGHLWIGDGVSGLTRHHGRTIEVLTRESVTESLLEDRAGRLWFANGNQLCCLVDGEVRQRRFDVRLFGLLIDPEDRLWLASWGEGLLRCDDLDAFETAPLLSFGEDEGLDSGFVAGLLLDRAGRLLVGTGYPSRLAVFDGERFQAREMPGKLIFRIYEDRRGRLWLGGFSQGGLILVDGDEIRQFGLADGLPSDAVQSLAEDAAGALWVGTRQGVCRFDGQRFTVYGTADGFLTLDNQVAVATADGAVWFGTKCGVHRWAGGHLQVLTTEDGLPGNAITSLVPQPEGAMLIGTFHGIVRYRPTATRPPLIEVIEVLADQIYPTPAEVTLTASGAALVTISFRGLSLGTRRMRYSYRLRGHEETWRDTWETQVRYTNLPVGRYTFEVLAVNRDGVVSQQPAVVELTVVVDPWREQQAEYEAEIDRMQALLELHQRTTRQNRALLELANNPDVVRGRLSEVIQRLCQIAASTLGADRASVWWLETGDSIFRCRTRYFWREDRFEAGDELPVTSARAFLEALEETRALVIDNHLADERCRELIEAGLQATDTPEALLAAPVRVGGRMVGLVCLARPVGERTWSMDEQHFAASTADLLSVAVEAHDRREAEARVSYQAQLLEQITDAIIAVDPEQRVTSWNQAAERLYGWTATEAHGRPLQELLEIRLAAGSFDELWSGLWRTGLWRGEATHRNRAGADRAVEWSLALVTESGGDPTGVVMVSHDVTERRAAEAEQRRLELQMQHAQKLESLGVLAGGIAHDFNNLLMGILGNAGLATIELTPESPARQSVQQIELAAQRAAELTRQMLAYSGRGHLEVRPLNLTTLVREMAHLLEVSISKKAILQTEFTTELPAIEGDATQIRQVVMNLITNASDALGDQTGVVKLATGRVFCDRTDLAETYLNDELPEGEYVFVEVTDTGCGMDETTRARIFEPFFTTKFTGRGLGLAAVLGIVRGHRGAIRVETEPGRGSSVRVLFPACGPSQSDQPLLVDLDDQWRGAGTILVVDDEEAVRGVVGRTLEQFGFEVLLGADGVEGLEQFRRHHHRLDLVVLDMTMPRMDGAECFRAMRAVRADIPVLLSSGYSEQEAIKRFGDQGLAGFLQKPYGPRVLLERIRQVLSGDR